MHVLLHVWLVEAVPVGPLWGLLLSSVFCSVGCGGHRRPCMGCCKHAHGHGGWVGRTEESWPGTQQLLWWQRTRKQKAEYCQVLRLRCILLKHASGSFQALMTTAVGTEDSKDCDWVHGDRTLCVCWRVLDDGGAQIWCFFGQRGRFINGLVGTRPVACLASVCCACN